MWIIRKLLFWIRGLLNRLLVRFVDANETNDVIKIVTGDIGLTSVNMENHVEIHNRFVIPYRLEEVRLTYYNDAGQNIGYLHFIGPVKIPARGKRVVKMPARMSNITAFFNAARLLLVDHIKTRTVGTTRIRFFGMSFELPIDNIMIVDRSKIELEQLDEEELRRRKAEREARIHEIEAKRAARRKKRESRRAAIKRLRRMKRKRSRTGPQDEKKPPDTGAASDVDRSVEEEGLTKPEGSEAPDPDRSY